MVTQLDAGAIFQNIGELLASVRALQEKIDFRHNAAEKMREAMHAELQELASDVRELQAKHDAAVLTLTADVAAIRSAQEDVKRNVEELREPVAQLVALRAKAGGALVVLGALGSIAAYFVPSLWRSLRHWLAFWSGQSGT